MRGVTDLQNSPEAHETEMLMEIMQKRTMIESSGTDVVKKIKKEVIEELKKVEETLTKAFNDSNISQAIKMSVKLQYLTSIKRAAENKIHEEDIKN